MTELPRLYTARMDVEPAFLPTFTAWYADQHAPDLIAAGFYSTQAYYSEVGTPLVCNIYEIRGADIFATAAYQDARARDPQRAEVLQRISNRTNSVYLQCLVAGRSGEAVGPVRQPWVSTLRLDLPLVSEPALLDWYRRAELERLRRTPGFVSVRVGRQDGRHPTAPSDDPTWAIFVEWEHADGARAAGGAGALAERHRGALGPALGAVTYNLVHRVFGLYAGNGR